MPIYEYRCDACDNVFEEWRRHADGITEEPCPECGSPAHRLISNTTFVLKGGGWYVTEYGNRGKDSSAKAPEGEASSGSNSKADSAPSAPAANAPAANAPAAGASSSMAAAS